MNFKKQIGFRLLAACLSTLIFLPQAPALAMQTISESGDISKSEKSKVKSQEANDVNMASENEVESTKKISKKGNGQSKISSNIAQTTFLGTLNLAQMAMLFALLRSSKEKEKRLSRVEDRLEDILEKKSEGDSSIKRSSIIKKDEDEDEKDDEQKRWETIQLQAELQSILFDSLPIDNKEILYQLYEKVKSYLSSGESKKGTRYSFDKNWASDMKNGGLYAVVHWCCNVNENYDLLLYAKLLALIAAASDQGDAVNSCLQSLNRKLLEYSKTAQQYINYILDVLEGKNNDISEARQKCVDEQTRSRWQFIARLIRQGAANTGTNL